MSPPESREEEERSKVVEILSSRQEEKRLEEKEKGSRREQAKNLGCRDDGEIREESLKLEEGVVKKKKKSRQGNLRGEEKSNWFHQSSISRSCQSSGIDEYIEGVRRRTYELSESSPDWSRLRESRWERATTRLRDRLRLSSKRVSWRGRYRSRSSSGVRARRRRFGPRVRFG
jgi:hypothetical protein